MYICKSANEKLYIFLVQSINPPEDKFIIYSHKNYLKYSETPWIRKNLLILDALNMMIDYSAYTMSDEYLLRKKRMDIRKYFTIVNIVILIIFQRIKYSLVL